MPPKKSVNKDETTAAGGKRKHDEVEVQAKVEDTEKESETVKEEGKTEHQGEGSGDDRPGVKADDDSDGEPKPKAAKTEPSSTSPLDWLLSDEAFDLANPEVPKGHGEVDWEDGPHKKEPPSESAGKSSEGDIEILRYPHSHLTPFQNLIAACLLSKPFSHRLGLRTTQTLLNPPFGIRTVSDLDEAGYEGRRKIMWEARTQHKEKTASQLGDLVDGVREICGEVKDEDDLSELKALKEQLEGMKAAEAQEKVKEVLTKIKGVGPGVAGIFTRRVQQDWEEVFPYADERAVKAAQRFGLIGDDGDAAEQLAKQISGDRTKYVRLLDTLVGLELEKVLDQAVAQAGVE